MVRFGQEQPHKQDFLKTETDMIDHAQSRILSIWKNGCQRISLMVGEWKTYLRINIEQIASVSDIH